MKGYKHLGDEELVNLLKLEKDDEAFTEIYLRYRDRMYLFAFKILHNDGEAEDIVQDIILSLWEKRRTINIHQALPAYLYSAVRYKALDMIARRGRQEMHLNSLKDLIDSGAYITDEQVRERELIAEIEKAVASLPEKMRMVFELSRYDSLSHKHIAAELNLSPETVKAQIKNALKLLRMKIHQLLLTILL